MVAGGGGGGKCCKGGSRRGRGELSEHDADLTTRGRGRGEEMRFQGSWQSLGQANGEAPRKGCLLEGSHAKEWPTPVIPQHAVMSWMDPGEMWSHHEYGVKSKVRQLSAPLQGDLSLHDYPGWGDI